MKIEISATGSLKQYLPRQDHIEISNNACLEALKDICGIPKNIPCGFLINGKLGFAKDVLNDGDKVVFIMIVGAG